MLGKVPDNEKGQLEILPLGMCLWRRRCSIISIKGHRWLREGAEYSHQQTSLTTAGRRLAFNHL
jgi:hypothetical protein